ncbi:hypothetical protein [Mesorhizobium sp.]|uniref:hypothetical protein n=1 Tax=Mesorhizobium sp. TaxID=1871066 RepID=UPI000FE528AA|nr:hypothetical protein [Mesorhizobium sp.]RWB67591.1 MAG: hypothetical protein EOQ49_25050 [Mesorhizobium sp.]
MSDQYEVWRRAHEMSQGRELTREQMEALGFTLEPLSGFWRRRAYKDGPFVAIAIWRDGETLWCLQNGEPKDCDDQMWSFCCRWPISEELYHSVTGGGAWPEEPPAPKDHNQQKTGDVFVDLQREYEAEKELAETFLKKPITTQQQADQAAIWSKRIAAIAKKATDLHKVEKQPSLDEGRRVDDKWRDLKERPAELSKRLKRHMDAYLLEQDRLERERQRAAQAEADRVRREAEEAAKRAEEAAIAAEREASAATMTGSAPAVASNFAAEAAHEADLLAKQAAEAEREAQARNANAGRTGAKVSLRTYVSARVTDYREAALALLTHPEMRALIDQLANRAIKAGTLLPGTEKVEEKRAA